MYAILLRILPADCVLALKGIVCTIYEVRGVGQRFI